MLLNGVHDDDSTATFDLELNLLWQFNFFFFFRGKKKKLLILGFWQFALGVSMFDPICEHDMNPTRVFVG